MYGFVIPNQGFTLLAKLLAGETLRITRVVVGKGRLPDTIEPATVTDLVEPVALATSTLPLIVNRTANFIIEYRSDMNGGLAEGFWLNEFGVFAEDPDLGEILLYYGMLGDYPQYVVAFDGASVDVRRFPVTIGLTSDINITLNYTAGAFMTSQDIDYYFRNVWIKLIDASIIPDLPWSKITTGKPTTIDGYGITDVVERTFGNNSAVSHTYFNFTTNCKMANLSGTNYFTFHIRYKTTTTCINIDSVITFNATSTTFSAATVLSNGLALNYGTKIYVDSDGYICIRIRPSNTRVPAYSITYSLVCAASSSVTNYKITASIGTDTDTTYTNEMFIGTWRQENALQDAWTFTIPSGDKLSDYVNSLGHMLLGNIILTISEDQTNDLYIQNFKTGSGIVIESRIQIRGAYKKFTKAWIIGNNMCKVVFSDTNINASESLSVQNSFCELSGQNHTKIDLYLKSFVLMTDTNVSDTVTCWASSVINIDGNGNIDTLFDIDGAITCINKGYTGTITNRYSYYAGGVTFDNRTAHTLETFARKATTVAGYGITDAAPKTHVGAGGAAQHPLGNGTTAGFSTYDFSSAYKTAFDGIAAGAGNYVQKTGDTMTGKLSTREIEIQSGYTLKHSGTTVIDTSRRVWGAAYNDLAELFRRGHEDIEPGDVLAYNWSTDCVEKANSNQNITVIGVCSDTYGMLLGGEAKLSMKDNLKKYAPVALAGRVYVKVIGEISPGDTLVTTSVDGVATAKSRDIAAGDGRQGRRIGIALAPFNGSTTGDPSTTDALRRTVGRIPMMVSL